MNTRVILISAVTTTVLMSALGYMLVKTLNQEQQRLTWQAASNTSQKAKPLSNLTLKPGLQIVAYNEAPSNIQVTLNTTSDWKRGTNATVLFQENSPCQETVPNIQIQDYNNEALDAPVSQTATLCLNPLKLKQLEVLRLTGKWRAENGDLLDMEHAVAQLNLQYETETRSFTLAAIEPCLTEENCTYGFKLQTAVSNEEPLVMTPLINGQRETVKFELNKSNKSGKTPTKKADIL